MQLNRRDFVKIGSLGLIGTTLSSKSKNLDLEYFSKNKLLAPSLKPGNKIAFVAPASPTNTWEIQSAIQFFKKNKIEVEIGNTILKQKNDFRYFSAPDKERAAELNSYFERDDINAIICGRGGYGMMRILPELKFDKLLIHPKIIMGFSDITALINSIYKKTGLVTFHGPVASYSFKDSVALNLNNLLFTKQSFSPINLVQPNVLLVNPGVAQGKLVGGNLTILSSLLGTEYEIETENSILFLEDVAENAYDIDRMLTQLLLANKIQKANAIIFGTFPNLNTKRPFFPNRGYSILEVINQLIKPLNKPTMIGLPFCHNNLSWTLPIGVKAEVDTNKGKITLLEQAVYY